VIAEGEKYIFRARSVSVVLGRISAWCEFGYINYTTNPGRNGS
jgi:hypothetical protein